MVDIHSHILWGLDDGAETLEESVAMLKAAALGGTTDMVATPHANSQYKYDGAVVEARIAELAEITCDVPRVHRGCDFHLNYENIEDALRYPGKYTINGWKYLMVEFPDLFIPPSMDSIFQQMRERGIIPVVTHPERNALLAKRRDWMQQWAALGCLAQVTAQSLTGRFGRAAEGYGWELLEKGLAQFVASDAHDPEGRHPRLDEARGLVAERMGADAAERLFETNPRATLTGAPLPLPPEPAAGTPKKKWFGLFGS